MVELDHILWAAPDLDEGTRLFEDLTGVAPARGGSHPGFGTRNSLVSLGDSTYFEIISPDPEQDLTGNLGGHIHGLGTPGLLTFALRSRNLDAVRSTAERLGLALEEPVHMSRTRPDGLRLSWSILYLPHEEFGHAAPFIIDWGDTPHPARTTPGGCTLTSYWVLHPHADRLARIYEALGLEVPVKRALRPGFIATLQTPKGDVVLLGPEQ
jgi:hypothetical protein